MVQRRVGGRFAGDRDLPGMDDRSDVAGGDVGRVDETAGLQHHLGQASSTGARLARHEVSAREARDERVGGRLDELGRRPELDEAAVDEHADPGRERGGILEVVGHQQRRNTDLMEKITQLEADGGACVRVERGRRLVEQQDLRPAGKRPRERDPLALPARQLVRAGSGQMGDPEALQQGRRAFPSAEGDVLGNAEVREQRVVLEHVTDRALLGRDVDAALCVQPDLAAEHHTAALGPQQSRDGAQDRRLSGARGPGQRDGVAVDRERQLEAERAKRVGEVDREPVHVRGSLDTRRMTRLTSTSSAPTASATSKSRSSSA